MNPINQLVCTTHSESNKLMRPWIVAGDWGRCIVNIAGLGPGDAVLSLGHAGRTVEAAVWQSGASLLPVSPAAGANRWPSSSSRQRFRADAVIWAVDGYRQPDLDVTMATVRQCLRPGGRLVAWAPPGNCSDGPTIAQRLQRLMGAAGFTSIISSSMSAALGKVVVATGIYVAGIHGIDCRSSASAR